MKYAAHKDSSVQNPQLTPLSRNNEQGGALWFILLGIALLAALTIAVTRSSHTVEQSGGREAARISASQMMRYAGGIEQAISQMRMRGVGENEISFENSYISAPYQNTNCTSTSCQVFSREGGGQTYEPPKIGWLDHSESSQDHYGEILFTGNACIPNIGAYGNETATCNSDTGNLDLLMIIPFIRKDLCLEINRMVGMGVGGADPTQDANASWDSTPANAYFTGSFTNAQSISGTNLDTGKFPTGCFEGGTSPSGGYHFYHVLLARPGG